MMIRYKWREIWCSCRCSTFYRIYEVISRKSYLITIKVVMPSLQGSLRSTATRNRTLESSQASSVPHQNWCGTAIARNVSIFCSELLPLQGKQARIHPSATLTDPGNITCFTAVFSAELYISSPTTPTPMIRR